jgi:hypothetical protein
MASKMKFSGKILSLFLSFLLFLSQTGFAQVAATELNLSSHFASLGSSFTQDKLRLPHLRYFSYDNTSNNIQFLLDKGDIKNLKGQELETSGEKLLKYFLIGITLPDEDFWVNLRPDSEENIIPETLARTDIGRTFLETDVQLKKDTASLTSPNSAQGKLYWDKLYQKAEQIYGTQNINIPTLTRPWIVPGEIIIRENKEGGAYIYKATLKVMLEQDYLKDSAVYNFEDSRAKELNEYSSQLIRDLILPELTKKVNNGKDYAALRQVYYSLILARWFKSRFYVKGGLYASYINKADLNGLTSQENWSKNTYFKQYQDSFKNGEYNLQSRINASSGPSLRSYFSGGIKFGQGMNIISQARGENPLIAGFTGTGSSPVFLAAAAKNGLVPFSGTASINNPIAISPSLSSSPVKSKIEAQAETLRRDVIYLHIYRPNMMNITKGWDFYVDIPVLKQELNMPNITEDEVKEALEDLKKVYSSMNISKEARGGNNGFAVNFRSSSSPITADNTAPQEIMNKFYEITRLLGINDSKRIAQVLLTSLDPVAFVQSLSETTGYPAEEIVAKLKENSQFNPLAADYELRTAKQLDPREFENRSIDISVGPYLVYAKGKQVDLSGQPLSGYLKTRRQYAGNTAFVFRDNTRQFVARFLGLGTINYDTTDLLSLIDKMDIFLNDVDTAKTKYVITSGIGANEMYSHQLAKVLNDYFQSKNINVRWLVMNNPADVQRIPSDADNENTVIFEMSRSGTTKETLDFFNATKDRFRKRVVAANPGKNNLNTLALDLKKEPGASILTIDDTRGDIGGRQMNRRTLMVYLPLYMALVSGLKNRTAAKEYLKEYVQEMLEANSKFDYGRGLKSEAVQMAEFLFRHRASGRNKFSVVYDNSLKATAKEFFQLVNEGGNKNIAGGSNNNILLAYSLQQDKSMYETVFDKAADKQLPVFILDKSSADYQEALGYINKLKNKGIPVIVIALDLTGDIKNNLRVIAQTSALLQDVVVYFTYITNQDANSNPAVKFVREITAAMFDIVKDKKAQGKQDIKISFEDVVSKIKQKQDSDNLNSQNSIQAKAGSLDNAGFMPDSFNGLSDAMETLARELELEDGKTVAGTFIKSLSKKVVMTDIGEAGANKVSDINAAFALAEISSLGEKSPMPLIPSLDEQKILDAKGFDGKISVAVNRDSRFMEGSYDSISEQLSGYFTQMYASRKDKLQQISLTYMEVDNNNPIIGDIAADIVGKFADKNITVPLLALPGVAHTGIEAVMSHPENVFNIAIVYTDTYSGELGGKLIDKNITLNDATYVYGISNVIRMALGGTPSVIFEVKNSSQLEEIKEIVGKAMESFKRNITDLPTSGKTGAGASSPVIKSNIEFALSTEDSEDNMVIIGGKPMPLSKAAKMALDRISEKIKQNILSEGENQERFGGSVIPDQDVIDLFYKIEKMNEQVYKLNGRAFAWGAGDAGPQFIGSLEATISFNASASSPARNAEDTIDWDTAITRLRNLGKVPETVQSFGQLIAYLAEYTNSELTLVTPGEFVTFVNLALTSLGDDFRPNFGLTPQDAGELSLWVPRIAQIIADQDFGDSVELLWQDLQDKMSSSPVSFRDYSMKVDTEKAKLLGDITTKKTHSYSIFNPNKISSKLVLDPLPAEFAGSEARLAVYETFDYGNKERELVFEIRGEKGSVWVNGPDVYRYNYNNSEWEYKIGSTGIKVFYDSVHKTITISAYDSDVKQYSVRNFQVLLEPFSSGSTTDWKNKKDCPIEYVYGVNRKIKDYLSLVERTYRDASLRPNDEAAIDKLEKVFYEELNYTIEQLNRHVPIDNDNLSEIWTSIKVVERSQDYITKFALAILTNLEKGEKSRVFEEVLENITDKKTVIKIKDEAREKGIIFGNGPIAGSSPVGADKKGGIDFRVLPMTMQPLGSFKNLTFALPETAALSRLDINREIGEISQMVDTGILPSGERVKELVSACYHKNELAAHQKELFSCLMRICRLEEDAVVPTDVKIKEAIVIVDSVH